MRFKKLLVAIDFSKPSRDAFGRAVAMAADGGASLVLAHVWHPTGYAWGRAELPPARSEHDYIDTARASLEEWKHEAEHAGAHLVTTVVLTGVPWYELVRLLERDPSFDLAVLGTHGRTGIRHVLIGSVAEKVVRHAPCPVLVVRTRD
jgi:nucleotide-binding universal stress UspA family protein